MKHRIYTGSEARELRRTLGETPLVVSSGRVYGDDPRVEYLVQTPGSDFAVAADVCNPRTALPCENTAGLLAAAPDLAASVEHHAARADAAEVECARLRQTLETAVAEERAAIVAMMRHDIEDSDALYGMHVWDAVEYEMDKIERGAHRQVKS